MNITNEAEAITSTFISLRRKILGLAFQIAEAENPDIQQELILRLKELVNQCALQDATQETLHSAWINSGKQKTASEKLAANIEADKARIERLKMEALENKGKTRAIVQEAVLSGMLTPVYETPIERQVNRQRRSNGGVVRIESGDGK